MWFYARRFRRNSPTSATVLHTNAMLAGSGMVVAVAGTTVVCDEKLFTVFVPSRFTSTVTGRQQAGASREVFRNSLEPGPVVEGQGYSESVTRDIAGWLCRWQPAFLVVS